MNKISGSQYRNSYKCLTVLQKSLESLSAIDQSVIKNDSDLEKIKETSEILRREYDEHNRIVTQGDEQFQNRNKELIGKAITAFVSRIPEEIHELNAHRKSLIDNHNRKHEELAKKGFSEGEIQGLLDPIDDQVKEFDSKIEALEIELKKVKDYSNDKPFFNDSLLDGTRLAQNQEASA